MENDDKLLDIRTPKSGGVSALEYQNSGRVIFEISMDGEVKWGDDVTPLEKSVAAAEILALPLRYKDEEIAKLRAENERLTKLASDRLRQRWDESKELRDEIKQLRAENERLKAVVERQLADIHTLLNLHDKYEREGD